MSVLGLELTTQYDDIEDNAGGKREALTPERHHHKDAAAGDRKRKLREVAARAKKHFSSRKNEIPMHK